MGWKLLRGLGAELDLGHATPTSGERRSLSPTFDLHQGRLRCVAPTVALHKERAELLNPYVVFLLYLVAILGFVFVTLLMNRVLGPKPVASAVKLEPFECGAAPVDARNVRPIAVKYFGVAVAFILFDLETVFLIVWVVGAQPLTGFMLFTFFIFIFLLVLVLLYVYKARVLEEVTE